MRNYTLAFFTLEIVTPFGKDVINFASMSNVYYHEVTYRKYTNEYLNHIQKLSKFRFTLPLT